MSLEILKVNGFATIQDSGRIGWRKYGVPVSGPMDAFAFHAANALVGNTQHAALEVGLGDITLRALQDCVISVTGAGFGLSIYIWDFSLWSSYYVRSGWMIRLNKRDSGMWAYLAIGGGVQTQPVLDSRATYLRGHFGGLAGRQLQTGDVLKSGTPTRSLHELAARTLSEDARPVYSDTPLVNVILGPQEKYFTKESLERFLSSEYSVSLTSDRMGYRLEGPPLVHVGRADILSDATPLGSIQVPASGQAILLMADRQTTGGYPKIATVISADMPLAGQLSPGDWIEFRACTRQQAVEALRERMRQIGQAG